MTENVTAPRSGRLFTSFLVLAVLGLLAVVVLLNMELNRTRAQLLAAEQALARERTRDSLAVGDEVGPVTLIRRDGAARTVEFRNARPTLVFMIAGHCPYCDETIPVWQRLLEKTESGADGPIAIVCVQSDARKVEELKSLPAPLEPCAPQPGVPSWLSRIPISPGVVLVGRDGIVKRTWFGVPSDRDEQELATVLLGGEIKK
jgi:thiol-disulfide isomerase/thioredoxin